MYLYEGKLVGLESNLWEALVHCDVTWDKDKESNPYNRLLRELGKSACMHMQELGVEPVDDGWLLHINACEDEGVVEILVPTDRLQPVEVLIDTRAGREKTWLGRLIMRMMRLDNWFRSRRLAKRYHNRNRPV